MRAIARVVVLCSVTAAADTNFSSTPAEGAIVLIGGGARTFLCTFPDLLKRLVVPLDASRSPHPGADLYAFLKTSDPGAKQQEGHNFTYPDVDAATLREALYDYRNVVGSTIVTEPACQGDCLIDHHVRCRERFRGFLGDPDHLARASAFAAGLEFLGRELEALEAVRGRRYAVVAWARPDVTFPPDQGWPDWTVLARRGWPGLEPPAELRRECRQDVDMARVMDRGDAGRFLLHPAEILRDCDDGAGGPPFERAEHLVKASAPPAPRHGCTGSRPVRRCGNVATNATGPREEAWGRRVAPTWLAQTMPTREPTPREEAPCERFACEDPALAMPGCKRRVVAPCWLAAH